MDDAKGEEGQSRLGSTKRNFEVWSGHRPMGLGDGKRSVRNGIRSSLEMIY